MKGLQELNVRKNDISEVREIKQLTSLQRLYLSSNQISSLSNLSNMPVLSEITLENNPIEKNDSGGSLIKTLRAQFPSIQYYNLQKVGMLLSQHQSGIN